MNVKELIEELHKLPPDLVVWIQEDPEGNGYQPLSGADIAYMDTEDRCVLDDGDYRDMVDEGYDTVEIERVVIIWP